MSYFEAIVSALASAYIMIGSINSFYDAYVYAVFAFVPGYELWYLLGVSVGSLFAAVMFGWCSAYCFARSSLPAWRRARGRE